MKGWPWDVRVLRAAWLRLGWDWLRGLAVWRMQRIAKARIARLSDHRATPDEPGKGERR